MRIIDTSFENFVSKRLVRIATFHPKVEESLVERPIWTQDELDRNSKAKDEFGAVCDGTGRWDVLQNDELRLKAVKRMNKHMGFLFREADRRMRAREREVMAEVYAKRAVQAKSVN